MKKKPITMHTNHTSFISKQIEWNARQYWIVVIKLACKIFHSVHIYVYVYVSIAYIYMA